MAEEEPIEIGFPMVAAYHGQSALAMAAIVFQAQRAAFALLSPEAMPARRDICIVSGHPGPGVRDAFEAVTRAVTRGAYVVDRSLPGARFVPGHDISYSFRITLGQRTAELALRPGVLPERFFELVFAKNRTAAQERELSALKRSVAEDVLAKEPDTLFTMRAT
ncbi:hypothetical protein C7U92_16015 [Bradyrhizobium sp. WBOS7]|uniref:Formylmethanofuran dehydrogenase subunit E domain-containing protein n=1 Tax=Bradyrhizobium betae TaxID=244734 RepID=A0AAE9NEF5_9BRAD|nr:MULTISPECIES: hypothetical protein [Bradyrhizobium]MDD1572137.1 hypothetical protein [Bradyrhizobium sp. WBOS1]UUO37059.1 hypothetical protein DCK84_22475 [Bradyrhizobium sp. WBOS01]MDD1528998.1 hypothetical protein [Bradyrhizobium sp. WBOS2]MDD1578225.1 hypothetical protein [Bradyrhizobium sp. WBOS7]MDD1601397.1 hypothetical protein [Bradyrhizobium sp. WBOS16]